MTPIRPVAAIRAIPVCCNSCEQALYGKFNTSLTPPTEHEIPLGPQFCTEDFADDKFKPVYDALKFKLNGNDAKYKSLCKEGRVLADAVEKAVKFREATMIHHAVLMLMTKNIIDAANKQPSGYDDSPNISVRLGHEDEITVVRLAVPDLELGIWSSMPKGLFRRLFTGAALEAAGIPYRGNWTQDEMSIIRVAAIFQTSLLPVHEKTCKEIREAKEAYQSRRLAEIRDKKD